MTDRELLIALVDNDLLVKSDAIVLLEGDGTNRVDSAADLYMMQLAPRIVFTGGLDEPEKGSFPWSIVYPELLRRGVPPGALEVEVESRNTRDQAVNIMRRAQKEDWRAFILVGSHYHQYRAYLTFLQARAEIGAACYVLNAPARQLSWYEGNPWGDRFSLLASEFEKIDRYAELGHVATISFAIQHQREKEAWTRSQQRK
jgi:uncharacterized SAM-binding protein YcdF (DUF218 family)